MKTLNDYFRDWEGEACGFGYGTGEPHTVPAIRRFFEIMAAGEDRYKYDVMEAEFGAVTAWLLINLLCKEDILEYGTSPRFGWLTEKGTALSAFMLSKTADELVEITWDGTADCTKIYCNCGPEQVHGQVCSNPFWGFKPD